MADEEPIEEMLPGDAPASSTTAAGGGATIETLSFDIVGVRPAKGDASKELLADKATAAVCVALHAGEVQVACKDRVKPNRKALNMFKSSVQLQVPRAGKLRQQAGLVRSVYASR